MFAHRTATGLTLALLALPATAAASPVADQFSGTKSGYFGWPGDPDHRTAMPTSSLAGTAPRSLVSPDAADAARAGDIAKAMEHYERSQPAPATAKPAPDTGDTPAWPELAFAGVVVLATAGGIVRVGLRRTRRVPA